MSFQDSADSLRKPVLVTGGAGYIGSHTCLELLNAGETVVVVDDLSNSSEVSGSMRGRGGMAIGWAGYGIQENVGGVAMNKCLY